MISFFRILGSILLMFSQTVGVWASGWSLPDHGPKQTGPLSQDDTSPKIYQLSLQETTHLALINNFDIQLAQYDVWIKRTDQDRAESIYDTLLDAEIEYRDDERAKSSTIAGTKTVDVDYNIGLSKKLPTGTTLNLDMINNRHKTRSAFATNPLTYESELKFTWEQELGRNFFGIQDRGDVKITKIDIENAEFTSLEKIEASLAEVQMAYWDLVLAQERLRIEEDILRQAQLLYEIHEEKLKNGLIERPEVLATQANKERRGNEVDLARNRVEAQVNTLKFLLNIAGEVSFMPTQSLEFAPFTIDLNQSLQMAFDHRRDYQRASNEIRFQNIKLAMEKNNIWPEINLTASFAKNGLGDHFAESAERITSEDNPDLFAGIEFSFPLENRKARSQLRATELKKARTLIELKRLEKKIAVEIMDQVRDCLTFKDVAEKSEEIARLQAQKLAEEEKRFRQGRSNTDILIRFQDDLIQDQLQAAQAKHRYLHALVDLELKSAVLLDQYWQGEL